MFHCKFYFLSANNQGILHCPTRKNKTAAIAAPISGPIASIQAYCQSLVPLLFMGSKALHNAGGQVVWFLLLGLNWKSFREMNLRRRNIRRWKNDWPTVCYQLLNKKAFYCLLRINSSNLYSSSISKYIPPWIIFAHSFDRLVC